MYGCTLPSTLALDGGVGGQHHAPAALPPVKSRYPLHRKLDGPQGRSGRIRKSRLPPGFDPRNVQPVPSHCTYCANPAPLLWVYRSWKETLYITAVTHIIFYMSFTCCEEMIMQNTSLPSVSLLYCRTNTELFCLNTGSLWHVAFVLIKSRRWTGHVARMRGEEIYVRDLGG